jgi:hypothetical protein
MQTTHPQYFDYISAAKEAGLSADQIEQLDARWREDYGADENLLELRLLRICRAIGKGLCTFQEAMARQ